MVTLYSKYVLLMLSASSALAAQIPSSVVSAVPTTILRPITSVVVTVPIPTTILRPVTSIVSAHPTTILRPITSVVGTVPTTVLRPVTSVVSAHPTTIVRPISSVVGTIVTSVLRPVTSTALPITTIRPITSIVTIHSTPSSVSTSRPLTSTSAVRSTSSVGHPSSVLISTAIPGSTIKASSSAGTSVASTIRPIPTPAPAFKIHPNGNAAKCLDVRGAIFANGTPVQVYDCNGTPAQNWVMRPGDTKVVLAGTGFCLDAGSSPGSGVGMKIWQCFDKLPAQDWYYTFDQRLALTGRGQCLDLTDGKMGNGNKVQTWKCTDFNTNQVWTVSN